MYTLTEQTLKEYVYLAVSLQFSLVKTEVP